MYLKYSVGQNFRARVFLQLLCAAFLIDVCIAADDPPVAHQYRVIKPIYLMGVYNSLNDRRIAPDAASAYLNIRRYYDTVWVAFQDEVPIGTIISVTAIAPRKLWSVFSDPRYLVRLEPDISRGLEVILRLDAGLEGSLDGLNPSLFQLVQPASQPGR